LRRVEIRKIELIAEPKRSLEVQMQETGEVTA